MPKQNTESPGQSRPLSVQCGKPNPAEAVLASESNSCPALDYYKQQLSQFLPIKTPSNWDERQDIEGFVEIWGESDHPWADSEARLARSLNRLDAVLRACSYAMIVIAPESAPQVYVPPLKGVEHPLAQEVRCSPCWVECY